MVNISYVEPPPSSGTTNNLAVMKPVTEQKLARKIEKINSSSKLMALCGIIAALVSVILMIGSSYFTGIDSDVLFNLGRMTGDFK